MGYYQHPRHEPTPQEIAIECQRIRDGWGPRDARVRGVSRPMRTPVLPVSTRFVVEAIRVLRSEMAHV